LCFSDCLFKYTHQNQTLQYDFSALTSAVSIMNGPSFTAKGSKYYQLFNISLCGAKVQYTHTEMSRNDITEYYLFHHLSFVRVTGLQSAEIISQIYPMRMLKVVSWAVQWRVFSVSQRLFLQMGGAYGRPFPLSPLAWLTLFRVRNFKPFFLDIVADVHVHISFI